MPPDSAGTATALLTGVKARLGVLGLPHKVERADCEMSKTNKLRTFITRAQMKGIFIRCVNIFKCEIN